MIFLIPVALLILALLGIGFGVHPPGDRRSDSAGRPYPRLRLSPVARTGSRTTGSGGTRRRALPHLRRAVRRAPAPLGEAGGT
jgi:hypothetical protein